MSEGYCPICKTKREFKSYLYEPVVYGGVNSIDYYVCSVCQGMFKTISEYEMFVPTDDIYKDSELIYFRKNPNFNYTNYFDYKDILGAWLSCYHYNAISVNKEEIGYSVCKELLLDPSIALIVSGKDTLGLLQRWIDYYNSKKEE